MAARLANWLAIALGGAGGTLAAVVGSASSPAAVSARALPLRPVSEISADVSAALPAPTSELRADPPLATPPSAATSEGAAATPNFSKEGADAASPSASAAAAASSNGMPAAAPATSADTAPLPVTPAALLRSEMRCDQGKSESCIVAARSYEAGSAGATDADKAAKYRRIALTMWISHCDHNSAAACVTLAKMYRAGEGVPRSDRNADALLGRAKELCRFTDVPVCHELQGI